MTAKKRSRLRLAATAAALFVIALAGSVGWLLRDPLPHVNERRSELAESHEGEITVVGNSLIRVVRLRATSGLTVNLTVSRFRSDTSSRPLPLVLLLGGHVTGAEATRLVGETPGIIVAAMSYPFDGDLRPSKLTFLRQIPRIREAFLDTPPALMLTLDYLMRLPNVDPARVHGVGVSLGAPFMTIAGALDKRFTDVWVIHGSGGSYAPLESSMRRSLSIAPLRYLGAAIANVIIDGPRLAPERWVSQISPRRFIMVNAEDDERLPRASVEALYRSAREPKEQIWMSGGHVHGDAETIQRLVRIVMARVSAKDGAAGPPGSAE